MDIYRLASGRVTSGIFLVGGSIIFGGALGLFLFVATLIPPLHAHLRKNFFF